MRGAGRPYCVAHVRIEIDGLVGVGEVFGLRRDRRVAREIFSEEIAIRRAPRGVPGGGSMLMAVPIGPASRSAVETEICAPRMKPRPLWSKLSALKSSIVCFCALGPM
jgi:hypothetical protein